MGVAGTLDATTVPDRYGLSWQVSPVAVDALMTPGDSATVKRVTPGLPRHEEARPRRDRGRGPRGVSQTSAAYPHAMAIAFHCRCGTLRGEIEPRDVYARAKCYCRDCQAFARALGREDVLDAEAGTDIVALLPAGVRFTDGADRLACLSLSPKGLLRWYARCCDTPIANTPRDPKVAYVGMLGHCLDRGAIDAVVGPARIALNVGSAHGVVSATPVRTFLGVMRIMRGVLAARLRGRHRDNPFFVDDPPRPIAEPRVLTLAERTAATDV